MNKLRELLRATTPLPQYVGSAIGLSALMYGVAILAGGFTEIPFLFIPFMVVSIVAGCALVVLMGVILIRILIRYFG